MHMQSSHLILLGFRKKDDDSKYVKDIIITTLYTNPHNHDKQKTKIKENDRGKKKKNIPQQKENQEKHEIKLKYINIPRLAS